jgi:pimeloyl-ACP methyl ester carboxylesterase
VRWRGRAAGGAQRHFFEREHTIEVPVLVVHGTADPMFPLAHGEALAEEILGARLLTLSGAGHGVYREDWETLAGAIVEHTEG